MTSQSTILIVEDAADSRLLLRSLLEDKYHLIEADSGEQCLNILEQKDPDLILLDINLPGISGYETCIAIRKMAKGQVIPVIFVSARDTTEAHLAGFEAGADDYLTKLVDGHLLLRKIHFHIQKIQERQQILANSQEAMRVAMEAMTSSSELGQIIHFVKDVQAIQSNDILAEAITSLTAKFGLNCCVLIADKKPILLGCEEESIEAKVLMKFRDANQRITHAGIRTVICYGMVVILIKNMPLYDEIKYGRLNDHLAVLIDVSNSRANAISSMSQEKHQQRIKLLHDVIDKAEKSIEDTNREIRNYSENVTNIANNMVTKLEAMLFTLGLEEDQEKQLMALANQTTATLDKTAEKTKTLDNNLSNILEALYDLLAQQ